MFRISIAIALALLLSAPVFALDSSPATQANDASRDSRGYASRIKDDYIRTELDWRSYYLNRIGATRTSTQLGPFASTCAGQPVVDRQCGDC